MTQPGKFRKGKNFPLRTALRKFICKNHAGTRHSVLNLFFMQNNRKDTAVPLSGNGIFLVPKPLLSRSQAGAWERICVRSPGFGLSPITGSRGFPGKCVPKLGLGNEKKS